MTSDSGGLYVELEHQVHPGLRLDLSFQIERESVILFGPSGSGKSTILRLIAGLTTPDIGFVRLGNSILVDSPYWVDVPLRERRIGLIFQDDLLFPHLNVGRNVGFGLKGWPRREAEARLREVSALCGIEGLLDRVPSTLSGGERQRVGLARALAPRPRLLLCDEPVSALDLEARTALIERIRRVQQAESIPLLYVTHSTDEAIALGTRLLLLSGGRIVEDGPPLDVLSSRSSVDSIRLRNVFRATVEDHDGDGLSTALRIIDGPRLIVPKRESPSGTTVSVSIEADDVVLSNGPIGAISARNLIEGRVERVVEHGREAEVLVRTGGVVWVVGVVSEAVGALGLMEGSEVRMIVKARSCQILRDEPS
jgi:molybdate transport system ATP-binding protein